MAEIELSSLRRALRRRFGFNHLREGQEEVIRSVLAGRDTLALMPTGAGKSLCYQLAGSQLPGITVIVSPLISLMKDQVEKMQDLGLPAAQLNSALPAREESDLVAQIAAGRARDFVFLTPERISKPELLESLRRNRVALFVVDEAHCVSEWGHDFRPAYLHLRQAISALGEPTVLALTATATERVIGDIRRHLGRDDMEIVDTGIYRQNLDLAVEAAGSETDKRAALVRLLGEIHGTGIVYTSTVRDCNAVAAHLAEVGHEVVRYHGRLGARERRDNQERFMAGEVKAVVATNAFGLGIDKPDIRFVIHYNLPGSLESYYQEAGRAGRDGEAARCVLIHLPKDRNTQLFFLNGRYPRAEHFAAAYQALERLGAGDREVTAGEIHRQAPRLAKPKIGAVLDMLGNLELAEEPSPGRYRLARQGLDAQTLEEMARRYRRRAEHDRERLKRMVLYAQTRLCRWHSLLAYFGEELPGGEGQIEDPADDAGRQVVERGAGELGGQPAAQDHGAAPPAAAGAEHCGHCDNCRRPEPRPPRVAAATPGVEVARRVFIPVGRASALPLPPLLGDRDPAALAAGDEVTLPIFGSGQVRAVAGDEVEVAFADGETRRFKRP